MGLLDKLTGRGKASGESRGRGVAALEPVPAMSDLPTAKLQSPARYLGTVDASGEKVVGQSLSVKSSSRLHLSGEGIDVVRMAGSFRVPTAALLGARTGTEFGEQTVTGLLVVRWEHDGQQLSTGFRMEPSKNIKKASSAPDLDQWVRTISKMARKRAGGGSSRDDNSG